MAHFNPLAPLCPTGANLGRFIDSVGFTIHDREDAADLMNLVRHQLGFSKMESRFPTKGTCLQIYSRSVNAEQALAEVLRDHFPWCAAWEAELRTLFGGYVEAKHAQNVLDYDDLLLYWGRPSPIPCSPTTWAAGSTTCYPRLSEGVQSSRRRHHARPDYRSTQSILAAANGVIDMASGRFTKNLWTERLSAERPQLVSVCDEGDQARYIADRVLESREGRTVVKQQAVPFRTSSHSGHLEVELTRRNIPFVKFGGLKFLDSAHAKDMLAVLRFVQNPRDRVASFRLMQLMPGVGPSSVQRVLELMADRHDPLFALSDISAPPRAGEHWSGFVETLQHITFGKPGWPAEIEYARRWYEPLLERNHEDASTRQADLLQLEQIAAGYSSRERFLTELTLDPPDATIDQAGVPLLDEDYLIL